jgi:hypothetical protein
MVVTWTALFLDNLVNTVIGNSYTSLVDMKIKVNMLFFDFYFFGFIIKM